MAVGITYIHDDVFREIIRLLLEEFDEIYTYEPKNPLAPIWGDKSIRPVIIVHRPEPGNRPAAFQKAAAAKPVEVSDSQGAAFPGKTFPEDTSQDHSPALTEASPEPQQVAYEIRIALLYGANIPQTVEKIRRETAERTKRYTGYDVTAVDVYITRLIRLEKERSTEHDKETSSDHQNDEPAKSPDAGSR